MLDPDTNPEKSNIIHVGSLYQSREKETSKLSGLTQAWYMLDPYTNQEKTNLQTKWVQHKHNICWILVLIQKNITQFHKYQSIQLHIV